MKTSKFLLSTLVAAAAMTASAWADTVTSPTWNITVNDDGTMTSSTTISGGFNFDLGSLAITGGESFTLSVFQTATSWANSTGTAVIGTGDPYNAISGDNQFRLYVANSGNDNKVLLNVNGWSYGNGALDSVSNFNNTNSDSPSAESPVKFGFSFQYVNGTDAPDGNNYFVFSSLEDSGFTFDALTDYNCVRSFNFSHLQNTSSQADLPSDVETSITLTQGVGSDFGWTSLGTVSVSENATLALGSSNISLVSAIANSGTVSVDANTIFSLSSDMAEDGVYTVISGGTVTGWDTLSGKNFSIDGTSGRFTLGSTDSAYTISAGAVYDDLEWSGEATSWSAGDKDGAWTRSSDAAGTYSFENGDSVTFNTANASVTVSGDVTPAAMTISADTTFTAEENTTATISAGSVAISDATVTLGNGVTLGVGNVTAAKTDYTSIVGTGTVAFYAQPTDHSSGIALSENFTGSVQVSGNANLGRDSDLGGATKVILKDAYLWSELATSFSQAFEVVGNYDSSTAGTTGTNKQRGAEASMSITYTGGFTLTENSSFAFEQGATTFDCAFTGEEGSALYLGASNGTTTFNGTTTLDTLNIVGGTSAFNGTTTAETVNATAGTLAVEGTFTVTGSATVATLDGSGRIENASGASLTVNGFADTWTGTVAYTGVAASRTAGLYGAAGSTVEFTNSTGYLKDWEGTVAADLKLVKSADTAGNELSAFNWTDGKSSGASTVTFSGALSGDGTLEKSTSKGQHFAFTGDTSAFTGTFKYTESNGNATLTFGAGSASANAIVLNKDATIAWDNDTDNARTTDVVFNYSNDVEAAGTISGASLVKMGDGALTLSGTNSYTGGTTISAGTLVAANSSALGSAAITNNAELKLTFADANTVLTNAISGTGSVNVNTTGEVHLGGGNSYTGGTTLSGGTLVVKHANALGTGTVTVESGNLKLGVDAVTVKNLSGAGNVLMVTNDSDLTAATLTVESTEDTAFSGRLSSGAYNHSLSLVKTGEGMLSISGGVNSFMTSVAIQAGTLATSGRDAIISSEMLGMASSTVSVSSGANLQIAARAGALAVGAVNLADGATVIADLSGVEASGDEMVLTILSATAINLNWTDSAVMTLSSEESSIEDYVSIIGGEHLSEYVNQTWNLADGSLTLTLSVPEPSAFGLLAGLGAIALAVSRRKRRA